MTPDHQSDKCPNCDGTLPANGSYCPDCGHARKKIYFGGDPVDTRSGKQSYVPIPWMAVLASLFIIPLATFGCCIVAINYDSAFFAALIIEVFSIAFGLLSIVINGIYAISQALKKK